MITSVSPKSQLWLTSRLPLYLWFQVYLPRFLDYINLFLRMIMMITVMFLLTSFLRNY